MKKFFCGAIIIVTVLGQTLSAEPATLDKRTAIIVTETERAFMLTEMRAMLQGTQHILQATLNQDIAAIIAAAKLLGLKKIQQNPPGLKGKLPLGFKKLAFSAHNAFEQLALDAKDLGDIEHSLEQLTEILGSCVACHAAYRLETNQASSK